jgi:hypothetical protein
MAVLVYFFGVFPPITVTDGHTTDDPPLVKKNRLLINRFDKFAFFKVKKWRYPPPPTRCCAPHRLDRDIVIGTEKIQNKTFSSFFLQKPLFMTLKKKHAHPPTVSLLR